MGILKAPNLKWLVWVLPLGVFVRGTNTCLQAWCIRRKAFKKTASSQIIRSGFANSLQITTGILGAGSSGLIASAVVADTCATCNLTRQIIADRSFLKGAIGWHSIGSQAKTYIDFPIYSASQNVMNALSQGFPVLILGHFYGIAVAGAYAFGIRILQAPMAFVLTAMRQVLFQKASETYNKGGKLVPLFIKVTSGLFALAVIPALVLFIWGPGIFSWIFGSEWEKAGLFASWLVLWLAPGFANVPSVLFARILRQQRNLFLFELAILISRLGALCLGGYYLSEIQTVILFSTIGFLLNMFLIIWVGALILATEKGEIEKI